ncbi:MAG: DJ-1/PfpI family protein [Clostridiales bacterium]|jgi:4-methyl-5(b-hydroxyethyl)-thiazole monophosphate biosynthesis|nr:DJ-1/PfpI family protein [Clostridiales bacterium]
MIYVFLAPGFEEMEALTTVDILRRAGKETAMVAVGSGPVVRGSHDIAVEADLTEREIVPDGLEAVVLPGGMPGTLHLERSQTVQRYIRIAVEQGLYLCAICAAPTILGHMGLLEGREAVCFPGCEQELTGARIPDHPVVVDGRLITAVGPGASAAFGLRIVSEMVSPEAAASLEASLQCR